MEINWKSIWNFSERTDGRTDIRGFGTDRLPYSEKLFLIVIFTDPTIISGTVDLRHYVIDTESVALTTSFFQEEGGRASLDCFSFFCIFNKGFSKDHKFSLFRHASVSSTYPCKLVGWSVRHTFGFPISGQ